MSFGTKRINNTLAGLRIFLMMNFYKNVRKEFPIPHANAIKSGTRCSGLIWKRKAVNQQNIGVILTMDWTGYCANSGLKFVQV